MFGISVKFEIKVDSMDAFLELMRANAATSLKVEKGCQVFDVCRAKGEDNTVFLYERYRDEAAFQAHLRTEHFLAFDAKIADMVVEKSITSYQVLS